MKLIVRLKRNSYLINCTITKLIKRVRKENIQNNFDLVEVECEEWKKIRLINFNGTIEIPEELENDEIVMWQVEKLDNSYNDISIDISHIKSVLKAQLENTSTREIQDIVLELQKEFDIRANQIISKNK